MLTSCSSRCAVGPSVRVSRALPFCARANRKSIVARAASVELDADAYIVLGVAHCFEKSDEGRLVDRFVLEPLSASTLECLAAGARTSFKVVAGVTLGAAMSRDPSVLPAELSDARYCSNWQARCTAAARTWTRPHAQDNLMDLVPLGRTRGSFNFNLDDKRVLNLSVEVKDEDNVKQDMSIDVYGRKDKAEAVEAKVTAALSQQAAKEAEEDELDKLLSF